MSDNASRFTSQTSHGQTTQERLSTNTVGLVALSDYRKRRAEVIEQQEREAREQALQSKARTGTGTSGNNTPDPNASDSSATQKPLKKKSKTKQKPGKSLLSFNDEDGEDESEGPPIVVKGKTKKIKTDNAGEDSADGQETEKKKNKFTPNASVPVVPKAMTKAALTKEAAEREALRQEFLLKREAVKAAEIAIPFVFYDGSNIPGGTVRVKKGDFIWVFLDKSRKVGAERGVGEKSNARRAWARVGVDDLMMVRGTIIIPHHYDFYYFLVNKSLGPDGQRIFNYSSEAPKTAQASLTATESASLETAETKAATALALPDIDTLEGARDDPNYTKVVDRRWYTRNKHIYPASTWHEYDAERDFAGEVRRDTGGNAFFFSR